MELNGAKILYTIHTNIPVLGDFKITQTLVSTWIVMALLSGLAFWLGRDLKLENVSKRQAAAEFIVERLDQFVHDNMGLHFDQYIPLVGAIFALSIGCNLISVVGLWSPTADLNTEAAWAIVVFVLIMYYKIKTNGILAYLKGLLDEAFRGQVHLYVLNFLKILCENGTLRELPGCARAYRIRYNAAHGILEATAITAIAMTAAQTEQLRQKLETITGKKIDLATKIDPSVLGGIRLDIEGTELDGTVQNRLATLRRNIAAATL